MSAASSLDRVRWVCISDLHLGDRDSLLTALDDDGRQVDPDRASPVLEQLGACLRELVPTGGEGPSPTLILAGDVLEMAFGSVSTALTTFERLGETFLRPGAELFDRIVLLPGNHDHHLWEMARETQFRLAIAATDAAAPLPPAHHVTPLTLEGSVPSLLLEGVLERVEHDPHPDGSTHEVRVLYPNLALRNEALDRLVLLHHGHYGEPLYHLFSRVRRLLFPDRELPRTVEEVESENFAWIDFVWSLFGRSGGAGADAERVFDMLLYPDRMEAFARGVADRAAAGVSMPFLPFRWLRAHVLRHVLWRLARRGATERSQHAVVCSEETQEGARRYLFGPAFRQVRDELGGLPGEVTFVVGHTHKPFERRLDPPGEGRPVGMLNIGGWVVDTLRPAPAFGGSVLLLNEALDAAVVRVYNDGSEADDFVPRVRETGGGAFELAVRAHVEGTGGAGAAWRLLGERTREEIRVRRANHWRRLES